MRFAASNFHSGETPEREACNPRRKFGIPNK